MTSATPGRVIDPRIKERRVSVLREQGRRRLRAVLIVLAVLCAAGAAWLVVESPLLGVHSVKVDGAAHESADLVAKTAAVKKGSALLFLDTGAIARRVETLPWVLDAHVERSWPSSVKITVIERRPVAWVTRRGAPAANSVALVDAAGRVLAVAAAPPRGLVGISDVRPVPALGATIAAKDLAGIVAHIPLALRAQTTAIAANSSGVVLVLARSSAADSVRLGDAGELADELAAASAVLDRLSREHANVHYIDVSVPDAPATA
jgi:cell division protein FtsQ